MQHEEKVKFLLNLAARAAIHSSSRSSFSAQIESHYQIFEKVLDEKLSQNKDKPKNGGVHFI